MMVDLALVLVCVCLILIRELLRAARELRELAKHLETVERELAERRPSRAPFAPYPPEEWENAAPPATWREVPK